MDVQQTWTDCGEAGDYIVPNVLSPRDLVSRPDRMDETVPHTPHTSSAIFILLVKIIVKSTGKNLVTIHR